MSQARVAFQYPSFRFFITARFLITASSEMQALAVAWQIYSLTHRALDLGLVGLAQFLPGMFLFLFAGHTADRFPRRNIIQTCCVAFSLCSLILIALTVRGVSSPWPIYAALLLNGVVRTFNTPASQAYIPQLVSAEHFPNAIAWGSSIFQGALLIGPMAGGIFYGIAGSPAPIYGTAAAGCLVAFLLVSRTQPKIPPRARGNDSLGAVLDGLRFIWREKIVLGAISLDLFAVLLGGAVALLPVFAKDILSIGATGLGVLRGAPGAGAIVMAVVMAHYPLRRHAGWTMLGCVAGFGICTIVFGLSRSVPLSLTALLLLGALDMVSVIIRHTFIQLGTPDNMRGRVSAVNTIFIGASNEVGQFESGLTAQWFGAIPAVVIGGIGAILVVLIWAGAFPALRHVDRLPGQPA